jgi:hypothetical protein
LGWHRLDLDVTWQMIFEHGRAHCMNRMIPHPMSPFSDETASALPSLTSGLLVTPYGPHRLNTHRGQAMQGTRRKGRGGRGNGNGKAGK